MICQNPKCKKETRNPKFCSSSCAAVVNNKSNPKRSVQGKCRVCQCSIPKRANYCKSCKSKLVPVSERRLSDFPDSGSYRFAGVRYNAVAEYLKNGRERTCFNCGYDKHVEICHITPISSYPQDTLVKVVNAMSNLVALCPNCHWELDHNMLKLSRATGI
jgi:5-methylcytosine-specific restriction endonuclease McrA